MIRQLMIDGELAGKAEAAALAMGYPDLEHYVMDLLEEDLDRIDRAARLTAYYNRQGIEAPEQ